MLESLSADRHNLVLFSGVDARGTATHEQLQEVKEKLLAKSPKGAKVDVHVVYSRDAAKNAKSTSDQFIDIGDNHLHTSYGMSKKAGYAYLRPDMYVAHIGHLGGIEELFETLGKN